MKKSLLLIVFVLSGIISFSQVLGEGDLVPNIFWKDSDGGEPQMKYLYDITSQNKYVWIDFSSTQCSHCNQEAPYLEESWQKYGKDQGDLYAVTSMFYINESGYNAPGFTWEYLNGAGWRTLFDPPLSFYLCSKDTGLYRYMYNVPENPVNFGVEGFPRNVLIGPDNIVAKVVYGFSQIKHLSIEAVINEGLGILPPTNLTAILEEDEQSIVLSWDVSANSARYNAISYKIFRNGQILTEIADINTNSFVDEDIEEGSIYYYRMSTTYRRTEILDLYIESLKTDKTEDIIVGGLGPGEWLSWGSGPFNTQVGVSRVFAYAVDFDLLDKEYILKAIEVANNNDGTVDWRIVKLGDSLIKGAAGDPVHCGNELIGTLEGTINTVSGCEPIQQIVFDTTILRGKIAVVCFASEGNKSLASNEEEFHADYYSEDNQTNWDWIHLARDLSYPKVWYLKIFVQEKGGVAIREFHQLPNFTE